MKFVSFVISAFNEQENVYELYRKLENVLANLDIRYELIFVNDGSTDNTLACLKEIYANSANVKILNLISNRGHEIAMTAGMDYAMGDAVLFMDADLQHPPELIPEILAKWDDGYELVLTRRLDTENQSFWQRCRGWAFYKVLNFLSDIPIDANTPDFRLIDRKYVTILKTMNENNRMFRGLISWMRIPKQTTIDFIAPKRFAGESKYSFKKLMLLAADSIVSFSIKPLRIATILGIFAAILSVILGFVFTIDFLTSKTYQYTGFGTLLIMVIFFGSIQLIFLGIIGEYLGRIHIEVKKRPLYIAEFYAKE
jgi:polyisoprenyl-phosphate glycosyltransferase